MSVATTVPVLQQSGEGATGTACATVSALPIRGPLRYTAEQYGLYFRLLGTTPAAARMAQSRWLSELPSPLKEPADASGRSWRVAGDALLPNGKSVSAFVQEIGRVAMPGEVQQRGVKAITKWLASQELLRRDREFQAKHPNLSVSSRRYYRELERAHGEFAATHGLSCRKSAMYGMRNCGGFIERRGETRGTLRAQFDEGIFQECVALRLDPNAFKVTGGFSLYEYGRLKAAQTGKTWAGGPRTFAMRLDAAVPKPMLVCGQKGAIAAEASCIPKMRRPRHVGGLGCGEGVSLDGRRDDRLVKVPDGRGDWRLVRPMEVVFFDICSGCEMGLGISEHEDAFATMAAFKDLLRRFGAPRFIQTDNSRTFAGTIGSKYRRGGQPRTGPVARGCELLGIEIKNPRPRHSWEKRAESDFVSGKELDRQSEFFVGGKPGERPEDAHKWAREHLDEVPTLEQYRAERRQAWDLRNRTPRAALGGLTPELYFEQHRYQMRVVAADAVDFVCTIPVKGRGGRRKVRRDGVVVEGIAYGSLDEDVFRLQGKTLFWRMDPLDASRIWGCDKDGHVLCIANCCELVGATSQHIKEVHRGRAKLRRQMQGVAQERNRLCGNRKTEVRRVFMEGRRAEQDAMRAALPQPPKPEVQIVGAHLVEPVKAAKRRGQVSRIRAQAQATPEVQDLLFTSLHPERTPDAPQECQADALVRFGHAG